MDKHSNIILFDGSSRDDLLPLTYTRPVAALRIGITTIKEKWELITGIDCSCAAHDYLQDKYPMKSMRNSLFIDGGLIPDGSLLEALDGLAPGEVLMADQEVLAYVSDTLVNEKERIKGVYKPVSYGSHFLRVRNTWDIFTLNDEVLRSDFIRLTRNRKSAVISDTNLILGKEQVFVEEGAKIEGASINAGPGPVYIGRNAEVMEGSMIRGPFALCEGSSLKLGAKIYGATTIGPGCKVGGEVHNSVFTAHSSKAHDGFLGNAVLGEWCNLGADTNNSNLKNNYDKVKLWNYPLGRFVQTGLQFCGLIMGDHSKCAINTMFNTGTVVGVSANIYGAGFPRNFVPSFTWGGPGGVIEYKLEKAFETASVAMSRRGKELDDVEKQILKQVYSLTGKYRKS